MKSFRTLSVATAFILLALGAAGCAGPRQRQAIGYGALPGDRVHLVTSRGTIVIELFSEAAPQNASSFADLVAFGFYDNLRWFEISTGAYAKTGCPRGDGLGGAGFFIPDEFDPLLRFDRPGIVAMANEGPNTNSSQFFITMRPLPEFNDHYTIIGAVVEGMGVVPQLTIDDTIISAWINSPHHR